MHLPNDVQETMSGLVNSDIDLIPRVRAKFEKLEEVCTQRYTTRENRVLGTINFGVSTLEQLQSWACFSLFAPDERNSDKYVQFIEYKYLAVIGPLRNFRKELEKSMPIQAATPMPGHTPRSPRPASSTGSSPRFADSPSTLKDRLTRLSQGYIDEGHEIRNMTLVRFQKCRKDIRTIYRWGQASLMDLNDVFDESLADELYFMVRGKLGRIMSTVSSLEDGCGQIERNLSEQIPRNDTSDAMQKGKMNENVSEVSNNMQQGMQQGMQQNMQQQTMQQNQMNLQQVTPGQMLSQLQQMNLQANNQKVVNSPESMSSESQYSKAIQGLNDYEIQYLEDQLAQSFSSSGRFNTFMNSSMRSDPGVMNQSNGHMNGSVVSQSMNGSLFSADSSGSTSPEPPSSPRPNRLVNHPKIMKDRLQNFSLPNKFVNTRLSNTW